MTVMNFASLAKGYRKGREKLHYKNTPVHRIVPDFVLQVRLCAAHALRLCADAGVCTVLDVAYYATPLHTVCATRSCSIREFEQTTRNPGNANANVTLGML